jgi:hypothetical protein
MMDDAELEALELRFASTLTAGDGLRAFGHAVAAAERERCAKLCDQRSADHWHDYKDTTSKFRGDPRTEGMSDEAEYCAAAIRDLPL